MGLLTTTIYLSCFMLSLVNGGSELRQHCYDPPQKGCVDQHILNCSDEEQVISKTNFYVSHIKKTNFAACENETGGCKNKTACCRFRSNDVSVVKSYLTADDNTALAIFIKTECSFKSSCKVSSYYYSGSSNLYDYINYTYSCIPASKDAITVDFLVNGSTKFTGNSFPTLYYLDYTGNGTDNKDAILNRQCIVTTTKKDITLTIKTLNLQADDCCRFYISGYIISEYCSPNGSLIPKKGKYIDNNTASIRLENVVNKDGDSFSILVRTAGNVTIDCRTIEHVDKQESTKCQYPTPESRTTRNSSVLSSTNSSGTPPPKTEDNRTEESETNLTGIIGGTVGGLVVLVVIIIVVVVIMRRRRRPKKVDENNYYSTVDDNPKEKSGDYPKDSSNYSYIDIDLDKVGYKTIPNNSTNQVKNSSGKDPKEVNKKNPIFRRQDFSFVEGRFGNNKERKDTGKPKGSNSKPDGNYNYTEIDLPKEDEGDDTYDHAQQGGERILNQKNKKEQNASDTYNHIGVDNPVAKGVKAASDTYNHIGVNNDNAVAKGTRAVSDTYNHIGDNNNNPMYKGARAVPDIYNHIGIKNPVSKGVKADPDTYNPIGVNISVAKEAGAVSDTYNHIGIKNSVSKGVKADPDTYNHIEINNSVAKEAGAVPDTYNHIGIKNQVSKGVKADPDTYNHIGVKNDNSVANGDNADIDTYNHIGVNNYVAKGAGAVPDTYNHIGVNNSASKGLNSDLDTYNHIGVNNYVAKGAGAVPDTYNHIGVNNSASKGLNSDLDTYNHIGVNNDNSVAKGANSNLDTYNHIGVNYNNYVSKGANSTKSKQALNKYEQPWC